MLIIGIVCFGLFWQSAFSSDVKEFSVKNFNKKLLAYTYIPKTKKCMPTKPAHRDAIKVKMADLEHNSLILRMKGIRRKDLDRIEKYQRSYFILKNHLER